MKRILLILGLFGFSCPAFSQDCEVALASIHGKYTGGCKNNKADGMGKSEGEDVYEGNFKSGFPSGEGTYTYKNGNFFIGVFKKGVKDGEGAFHYKTADADSVIKGFWKNDLYAGAYLHPYVIERKSAGFSRLDVKQDVGLPDMLTIESSNVIKSNSLGGAPPPLPVIINFAVNEGSYEREEKSVAGKTSKLVIYGIKFPFHISVNYGDESFEVFIYKEASWNIHAEISIPGE